MRPDRVQCHYFILTVYLAEALSPHGSIMVSISNRMPCLLLSKHLTVPDGEIDPLPGILAEII